MEDELTKVSVNRWFLAILVGEYLVEKKSYMETNALGRTRIILHRIDERYIQFVRYHNYQVDRGEQDWKETLAEFYHYQPLFQNNPLWEEIKKLLTEGLDKEGNTATSPMQYLTIPQTFPELERIDEHIQQVKEINNLINNQREQIWRLIKELCREFEIAFQKWQKQQEQKDKEESIEDNFPENNNSGSGPKNPVSYYSFPENDSQADENKDENSVETGNENETKDPQTFIPTDKDQNGSSLPTDLTDEIKVNTPLSKAQKLVITKIQKLLEANSLQIYDLPSEYQNWKEVIQKLETTEAIINYLSQIQKVIIEQSQIASQRVNNSASLPKPDKNLPLFFLGLVMITIGGGLIVLLTKFFKNNNKYK